MRRSVSLLLFVVLLILAITGLYMIFSHRPPGLAGPHPANVVDGRPAGEDRPHSSFNPKEIHEFTGFAMLVLVPIHLALNFSILMRHLGLKKVVKTAADSCPS